MIVQTFRLEGFWPSVLLMVAIGAAILILAASRGAWGSVLILLVLAPLATVVWRERIILAGDLLEYRSALSTHTLRLSRVEHLEIEHPSRGHGLVLRMQTGSQEVAVPTTWFRKPCHEQLIRQLPERLRARVRGAMAGEDHEEPYSSGEGP